jgi:hypothetical protein
MPLPEFARQVRDLVDRGLRTPGIIYPAPGGARPGPPVDSRFHLEHVLLRDDMVPPEIHIIFCWAEGTSLLGVREEVEQDDDEEHGLGATIPEALASFEENLVADRYGIGAAIRETRDNVTWLRWT